MNDNCVVFGALGSGVRMILIFRDSCPVGRDGKCSGVRMILIFRDSCPVGRDGKCSPDFSNELALRYGITSQKTRTPDTEFITVIQVCVNTFAASYLNTQGR